MTEFSIHTIPFFPANRLNVQVSALKLTENISTAETERGNWLQIRTKVSLYDESGIWSGCDSCQTYSAPVCYWLN